MALICKMKLLQYAILISSIWIHASCQPTQNDSKTAQISIEDGLGRKVLIPSKPLKILGLSPAVTEMLFFILPDSNVAGVTFNCNYPPEKVALKQKINTYPLDIESILAMKPDLIFSEEGITSLSDASQLEKVGFPVCIFKYRKTRDILNAMDSIWKWCPHSAFSLAKINFLRTTLDALEKRSSSMNEKDRPKMLAITWLDPIFAFGAETWLSDIMRLAGGRNCLETVLDKPYPSLQRETVLKLNPDILYGGNFEKMDSTFFTMYPELKSIPAYKNKKVYELNDDLASRPGPRFLESVNNLEKFK